ncbi:putative ribonuclease p/mrp subunit [Zopfia rhizophila CBS 207.26]|uniref:Putative ribonuclease p/mrp subunit n=1 Tax=Zopfia rhizophila CBS 207.26 TaxID=1314779 RepID=A0A6A6DR75_9PEZI|nr:putative ribonuclease p/mrp subunit [Zopfia rhizophila CBS 207.26]
MASADPHGLGEPFFNPPDAKVDIVFVHGLGGDRIKTWTSKPTEDIPKSTFWPKDLLPETCKAARILSFGYDSSFEHFYPLYSSAQDSDGITIDDHSGALLQSLARLRDTSKTLDRPIIFVTHSLGGLVCAHALSGEHSANESHKRLVDSTRGIVFLGTPFEDTNEDKWASVARQFLKLARVDTAIDDLNRRSQKLISINGAFLRFLKARDRSPTPVDVACFFEGLPTYFVNGTTEVIVSKSSATFSGVDPLKIPAKHDNLCRFGDKFQDGYIGITKVLNEWIRALAAPRAVDNSNQHSIRLGNVVYNERIDRNQGVIMGHAYGTTKEANRIIGSTTVTDILALDPCEYFYKANFLHSTSTATGGSHLH